MNQSTVRVRFAPSPTGYLHVGGARTALYNYLYAKHMGGTFILRVEDTDLARSTEESMRMQFEDLTWLGLNWDEGIDPVTFQDKGPYAPYRQSQRQHIYKEHAERLVREGKAYYCFMTDEDIEQQKATAGGDGRGFQATSPYRDWPMEKALEKIKQGETASIRFKVHQEIVKYSFKDLVRGEVSFPSDMVGDFVILRSNGMPVYNFCCVVDDALMKITHVLRAEEHLSNTLRQLMLYEAFDYEVPQFAHMSIILGSDRQKLSKRHGATSCHDYRVNGFLPEAMNNFIALLGWSSPEGQEVMTMKEMISQFSLERLNAASAVFDEQKLRWMNATHLRQMPIDELRECVMPFLQSAGIKLSDDSQWQNRALEFFKTYMETFADAVNLFRPLSDESFAIGEEAKEAMSWESTRGVLLAWKEHVSQTSSPYLSAELFDEIQNKIKVECNIKGKFLFMPIRVAIIGKPHGAELKELVPLMKKESLVKRVEKCLQHL